MRGLWRGGLRKKETASLQYAKTSTEHQPTSNHRPLPTKRRRLTLKYCLRCPRRIGGHVSAVSCWIPTYIFLLSFCGPTGLNRVLLPCSPPYVFGAFHLSFVESQIVVDAGMGQPGISASTDME